MPSGYGTDILGICKGDYTCKEYISNFWNANNARQDCDYTWTAGSTCPDGYDWRNHFAEQGEIYYGYSEPIEIPDNATQLSPGVLNDGEIATVDGEVWYSFNVISGTPYYVYLADSDNNEYYIADVRFAAYNSNGIRIFDTDNYPDDNDYQYFLATSTDKIYVRVYGSIGTFGIKYGVDEPW
jgi:hypothetical protein